jgi:hypothetical protein
MTSPLGTHPPSQRETPAPEPPQAFPGAFQKADPIALARKALELRAKAGDASGEVAS